MLRLLVLKEIRNILTSWKFAVSFGAMAVLLLIAFFGSAFEYRLARTEYEAAVSENLRQMEGNDWRRVNTQVFLNPRPLGALVSGISNDIGRSSQISDFGAPDLNFSRFGDMPIYAVFRLIDLEFIVTVVLSLLAILFAFDSVNGEKQQGTLSLSLSNAVPRDLIIAAKSLGYFIVLGIPLLIPLLLGVLIYLLMGLPMTPGDWIRFALIVVAAGLYLGVFLLLSILVSSLTHRPQSSFAFLLLIWILAVLVLPRLAVSVSGRAVTVPSSEAIGQEIFVFNRNLMFKRIEEINEFSRSLDWRTLSEEGTRKAMRAQFEEMDRGVRQQVDDYSSRLFEDRRNRELARQTWATNVARISPAASYKLAATALAGTSLTMHQRFFDQILEYRTVQKTFVQKKLDDLDTKAWMSGPADTDPPIDPNEMPAFSYGEPGTSALIAEALPDLGLLIGFNLLFFAAAFVAFRRYDVR